jgi:hypothetical protein
MMLVLSWMLEAIFISFFPLFSDCDVSSSMEVRSQINGIFYQSRMVKRNDRLTVSAMHSYQRGVKYCF